jgi:hypothetical protein
MSRGGGFQGGAGWAHPSPRQRGEGRERSERVRGRGVSLSQAVMPLARARKHKECEGKSAQNSYPANSRERAVAAAMASLKSRTKPSGRINTASAAAVVPPGEVTFWRKVAASSRD